MICTRIYTYILVEDHEIWSQPATPSAKQVKESGLRDSRHLYDTAVRGKKWTGFDVSVSRDYGLLEGVPAVLVFFRVRRRDPPSGGDPTPPTKYRATGRSMAATIRTRSPGERRERTEQWLSVEPRRERQLPRRERQLPTTADDAAAASSYQYVQTVAVL